MLKWYYLIYFTTIGVVEDKLAKMIKLANTNAKLDVSLVEYTGVIISKCVLACAVDSLCLFVSYHSGYKQCGTHAVNATGISRPGWTIYYKQQDENGTAFEFDVMKGATAFQSSTGWDGHAMRALDGNPDWIYENNACSHTENFYSYWIMEFGMPGVVNKVHLHLRERIYYDPEDWSRNTFRYVMVALNKEDAIARTGEPCGNYTGPPIEQPPYLLVIKCYDPLYGSFLRVSHDYARYMELCEVVVFVL